MSFHTYEDLCYDLASSCEPLIRGTTTTAHHEYDTNWTSRAIGRSSMITGHNASTLARPHRPFLERKVAGPSPSASCRASSADGRSLPTGILVKLGRTHERFRPLVGTSENWVSRDTMVDPQFCCMSVAGGRFKDQPRKSAVCLAFAVTGPSSRGPQGDFNPSI